MKEFFKKKSNIFLCMGIVMIILMIIIIILLVQNNISKDIEKQNSTNSIKENGITDNIGQEINDETEESQNKKETSNEQNVEKKDLNTDNSFSNSNQSSNTKTTKETKNETPKMTEASLINYFDGEVSKVNTKSTKEKVKTTFTDIIDFIFYGKEIKGYTFKQLTTAGKLKVIKLALTIDHKIDQYFPNYKDTIKGKYNNVKGKLAVYYLEGSSKLCTKVGSTVCNQARSDFKDMKKSFNLTFSIIKEGASKGKTAIAEWYQIFKSK